jgi:hypothetical protein
MTPTRKEAEDLYREFKFNALDKYGKGLTEYQTKDCIRILVDRIIKFGNEQGIREPMMYWHKVKQEIEKL